LASPRRHRRLHRVRERFLVIGEEDLEAHLRARLSRLLAATLDDGPAYLATASRTLVPFARALAIADGSPVGHAACFRVPCRPQVEVRGLGDVAVDGRHRGRGIARRLCEMATAACWNDGAEVIVAKTRPLRRVAAELGYTAVEDFSVYVEDRTSCWRHPEWMAARRSVLPRLQLLEGDF
jgi:GNAT superfamily N-acetyltransferase